MDYNFISNNKKNIIIQKKNKNSYIECINLKLTCSWSSTMIIKMKPIMPHSYFLGPGLRNDQFLALLNNSKILRIQNYHNFEKLVLIAIKSKKRNKIDQKYLNYNKDYNYVLKNICKDLRII